MQEEETEQDTEQETEQDTEQDTEQETEQWEGEEEDSEGRDAFYVTQVRKQTMININKRKYLSNLCRTTLSTTVLV